MCEPTSVPKAQLDRAVKVIENGADTFQRDEAGLGSTWRCYCDQCANGFPAWLKRNTSADALTELGIAKVPSFDYRAVVRAGNGSREVRELWIQYKDETIRDYHLHIRDGLRKRFPHFAAYTANNSTIRIHIGKRNAPATTRHSLKAGRSSFNRKANTPSSGFRNSIRTRCWFWNQKKAGEPREGRAMPIAIMTRNSWFRFVRPLLFGNARQSVDDPPSGDGSEISSQETTDA